MHLKGFSTALALLLCIPGLVQAADYKQWLPFVPDTFNGKAALGDGDGMNMSMGADNFSTLAKSYGDSNDPIDLMITYDGAGHQVQAAGSMAKLNFSTDDAVMKTLKIQGYDAYYTYDRISNMSSLTVFIGNHAMVSVSGKGKEAEYTKFMGNVKLQDLAARLK